MKIVTWFVGLDRANRIAVTIVAAIVGIPMLVVCAVGPTSPLSLIPTTDRTSVEAAPPSATPTPEPEPVVTTEEVVITHVVPFAQVSVDDGSLASGTTAVTTVGVTGSREEKWVVTYTDGVETGRVLRSDTVVIAPIDEVTSVGTYVAPPPPAPVPFVQSSTCDPNYSGACVPIDSDVDCAGGSGNGPSYVRGPVTVIGSDIYDLDRDGDGVACE